MEQLLFPELQSYLELPQSGASMAGIDEAGRGCLAGPVVAAAVILPEGLIIEGIKDSKQLSPEQRNRLRPLILQKALAWGIGIVWSKEIDKGNILSATFEAMAKAVAVLARKSIPELLLVDGNKTIPCDLLTRFLGFVPRQRSVIKGDSLIHAISAASILAKTQRDRLMVSLAKRYPLYGFEINKGYGTEEHLLALQTYGPSPLHRMTFQKVAPQPPKPLSLL